MEGENNYVPLIERLRERFSDPRGNALDIEWLDDQPDSTQGGDGIELLEDETLPLDQIRILDGTEITNASSTSEQQSEVQTTETDELYELVQRGELPKPGDYKTEFVVAYGDTGLVSAKVYHYAESPEEVGVDAVSGEPLRKGELVVRIGSSGPITWDTFKTLVQQSRGRYFTGINITQEDL